MLGLHRPSLSVVVHVTEGSHGHWAGRLRCTTKYCRLLTPPNTILTRGLLVLSIVLELRFRQGAWVRVAKR